MIWSRKGNGCKRAQAVHSYVQGRPGCRIEMRSTSAEIHQILPQLALKPCALRVAERSKHNLSPFRVWAPISVVSDSEVLARTIDT